jgi:hypothetical protein
MHRSRRRALLSLSTVFVSALTVGASDSTCLRFQATRRARPRDMKISALAMLDEHRMLVLERTDFNDGKTIAIANDNDFGVGTFTVDEAGCQLVDSGRESEIIVVRLSKPLKR